MSEKNVWKSKTINVPMHYLECPFCEWTWEETRDRWPPKFCGECGKRLYTEEEYILNKMKGEASCENCEHARRGADLLNIFKDSNDLFYCLAGHGYCSEGTVCSEWKMKEGEIE